MNHELASEIRLFAKMIETFHGEYAYQGWVHTMKDWAGRIDRLAAPDTVHVLKEVNYENDYEHLTSIHATRESAEREIIKEWGDLPPETKIEAWMVHP